MKFFFDRKLSSLTKPEATLVDRIDLRISGQPEEQSISGLQSDEASLEVSKQIDNDQWFDQELFTEE